MLRSVCLARGGESFCKKELHAIKGSKKLARDPPHRQRWASKAEQGPAPCYFAEFVGWRETLEFGIWQTESWLNSSPGENYRAPNNMEYDR